MGVPGSSQLQLFTAARNLVPQGKARDTLHILLAAVTSPEAAGPASEVIRRLDDARRWRLYTGLKMGVDSFGEALAFGEPDRPTDRLRQCEERWQQQARLIPAGLTSALVLATIVSNDGVAANIVTNSGIEPRELYQALEPKFGIPENVASGPPFAWPAAPGTVPNPLGGAFSPSPSWGPAPGGVGAQPLGAISGAISGTVSWEEQRAWQKAMELAKPIDASRMRVFRDMHPVAMNHFLNELSHSAGLQDVPILVGRRGSPLDKLGQVLADRIGIGERFAAHQEPLNRYRAIYRLDALAVMSLASTPGEPPLHKVVEAAKLLVQQQNAILLIDHVEAWRGAGVAETLRAQLANRGTALLCGVYHATDEPDVFAEAALGLANAKLVHINAYSPEETREFVQRFYVDYWASSGFVFAPDTFDSLYHLEQGCWINLQRMALPYLVVNLAEDTIQMAMKGEDTIKQTIQEAVNAMKQLLQVEWPTAPESVKSAYQRPLQQVQDDLNNVARNHTPKVHNQYRKMLTRGHLMAQLFCPNESEFHLPGNGPRSV